MALGSFSSSERHGSNRTSGGIDVTRIGRQYAAARPRLAGVRRSWRDQWGAAGGNGRLGRAHIQQGRILQPDALPLGACAQDQKHAEPAADPFCNDGACPLVPPRGGHLGKGREFAAGA